MGETYSVVQGTDAVFYRQETTDGVTPSTAYDADDVLESVVWRGNDQPVLFTPAPSWVDATIAFWQVAMAGSQTADIEPGTYDFMVTVSRGGQVAELFYGQLEIKAAPGSAAEITADITYAELTDFVPQIRTLFDPTVDATGFLKQRHEAQQWFIDSVTDRYRPQVGRSRRYMNAARTAAGTLLVYAPSPLGSWEPPSIADLMGYFAAGGLVLTESIRQCQAHYAAAIILLGQPGRDNVYVQAGTSHRAQALSQFPDCVVELDTTDPPSDPPTPIIRVDRDVTWLT